MDKGKSARSQGRGAEHMRIKPGTIKRLLSQMAAFKGRLALVILCLIISAAVGSSTALFLRVIIDDHILSAVAGGTGLGPGLIRVILLMAATYSVGIAASWASSYLMVRVEQGTLRNIREKLFSHMQTLPVGYFDTHPAGDVMSRFTNDTDTLRQAISQSIPQMFGSLVSTLAAFFSMLYLSVGLTAFVIAFSVILYLVLKVIVSRSSSYFIKQQATLGKLNAYVEEMVSGQKVVKVFTREEKTKEGFDERNEELCYASTQAGKLGNITMPVVGNFGYLLYVLLALVGGAAGIAGLPNLRLGGVDTLTIGTIVSFLTLARSFVNPIGQISMQFNMITMALAGASRIFSMMDEKPEEDQGTVTLVNAREEDGRITECETCTQMWAWKQPHSDGTVTYTRLQGDITFNQVDFEYVKDKPVLHDISLYARPGQKVAFVGATGAGKTTITNLINRFYDIADGKIRYDGININKIKKADLRRSLGVVLQDVNLFTGTVMENIRYGKLDATDDECVEAARLANADGFIRMLPHGYQTVLEGDGSGLSQGQRQLISISRAAVANPPVMILDEATSSIDTRTESIVQQGMDALMKGRTVFVIAHRLSTVRNSDVIMVLENGRIIERGSHDSLIAQRGRYYQLYTGVFELE